MIDAGSVPLEAVVATHLLAERKPRAPEFARENQALLDLAAEMGQGSRRVLQHLSEIALDLCRAGSAGVSILENDGERMRFRWHALTGELREHRWGVTPRDFSPCGTVLDRNAVQLFLYPERHFRYFAEVKPQIIEGLLVPFGVDGQAIGTIWVIAHDPDRHFDAEDARLITTLGRMAASAHQVHGKLEALRASGQHKDEFLSVLSHEMRNPLAAMSNSLRFLADTAVEDPDQARARAVMQRQLAQVSRLTEDLLDVSRVGQGSLELRRERTDLVAAVRSGREAATPALAEYGRAVDVLLPDAPLFIEGDPARLSQIVTNLLTNAARRTMSGGTVSVVLSRDGGDAVILVSSETEGLAVGWTAAPDDGAPRAALRDADRPGIGLTLARSLAELQGGSARAVSTGPLHHNGFEVRLPLLDAAQHVAVERTVRRAVKPQQDLRRHERVLIVDDCVDSSDSLAMLLRSWGHDVRVAQGAVAGLQLEWDFRPHAVILDIEMPGKDGYEVAAELRVRRRRELLLVALSGHAREEDRGRSLGAGFDHHLTKPADVEMLRHLLS